MVSASDVPSGLRSASGVFTFGMARELPMDNKMAHLWEGGVALAGKADQVANQTVPILIVGLPSEKFAVRYT